MFRVFVLKTDQELNEARQRQRYVLLCITSVFIYIYIYGICFETYIEPT